MAHVHLECFTLMPMNYAWLNSKDSFRCFVFTIFYFLATAGLEFAFASILIFVDSLQVSTITLVGAFFISNLTLFPIVLLLQEFQSPFIH